MSWNYSQRTGELSHPGRRTVRAYSGLGAGKNNPAAEGHRDIGPIPRGHYRIGRPHASPKTGSFVMDLAPIGHNAYDREGFQIHGESNQHPGRASTGCIVVSPLEIRLKIWDSGDHDLEVMP